MNDLFVLVLLTTLVAHHIVDQNVLLVPNVQAIKHVLTKSVKTHALAVVE